MHIRAERRIHWESSVLSYAMLTGNWHLSSAESTQPTVPSPPHTNSRQLCWGRRRHISSPVSGGISDTSITWEREGGREGVNEGVSEGGSEGGREKKMAEREEKGNL